MRDAITVPMFGQVPHTCRCCGRVLTSKESIRIGIGSRCLKRELMKCMNILNDFLGGAPYKEKEVWKSFKKLTKEIG